MFTISNLFIYSLVCSVGLLLMFGAIRFSKVSLTVYGRPAILGSVLTVALAAGLPLLTGWLSRPELVVEPVASMGLADAEVIDVPVLEGRTHCPVWPIGWWNILCTVYIIGLTVAFVRFLITIFRIFALIHGSQRVDNVLVSDMDDIVPFTWGGYIIMSRRDYETNGNMLLTHESAHRAAHHWLDLLFMNLLGCLTWYCPAARLIRRELQSTHEFAADRAVLAAGFDAKDYQMLLISKASGRRFANSVADCINNHSLKSRIIMMQKKSPMRHRLLRSLTLVPAAITVIALASSPALASMVSSTMPAKVVVLEKKENSTQKPKLYVDGKQVESIDSLNPDNIKSMTVNKADGHNEIIVETKTEDGVKKEPVKVTELTIVDDDRLPQTAEPKKDEEKVFTACEESPKFKGGDANMYMFLSRNIRYPEEAAKKNIQGRVTVQFVVKKDGSIGEVKVVRGVDPDLDAEAIRVIKSMPDFEPGKMNGEPVNVWYTLPLNFKIQSDPVKTDSLKIEETKK